MRSKDTKAYFLFLATTAICCCISFFGNTGLIPFGSFIDLFTRSDRIQSNVVTQIRYMHDVLPGTWDADERCPSIQRQQEQTELPLTYEAIIPGIDERLITSIVTILSGLPIINIDNDYSGDLTIFYGDEIRRWGHDGRPTIQRTQYPYNGEKDAPPYYSKDGGVSRAVIVIQNPLRVFSHRFITSNDTDWIRWSEVQFDREVDMFQRFLCYWFDSYTPESRLVVSYEDLFTEQSGISTIMALNNFLGGGVVDAEIASCLWGGMCFEDWNYTCEPLAEKQLSVPQYPYTPSQLTKLMSMIEVLSQKYEQDKPVNMLLMQYHEEVRMIMSQIEQAPEINEQSAPAALMGLAVGVKVLLLIWSVIYCSRHQ